ncbi:MAG: ornithine carbamoyltransferase [PVC group bacterium]|nr:ornithine carbamoyltransferase [PVC group bacterium]
MNKDLLSGFDLTEKDVANIFKQTKILKKKKISNVLNGKVAALVFQKPSNRTRVSFEVGARQLGAYSIYLAPRDIRLGEREPIKDVARVLARYADGIIARTFSHEDVCELAKYSDVGVINGLSDMYHPCQALADVYTVYENAGKFKGVKLAYVGDGNNVVHSLLAIGTKVGLSISVATPKGYEPDKEIWAQAVKISKKTKAKILHTHDPEDAVKGADFIYTDVWTSMGQEKEKLARKRIFKKYQINSQLLKKAKKNCLVLHCMPMHRGEEITDEVAESKQSVVFDQAENRLHVQKAVMAMLFKKHK